MLWTWGRTRWFVVGVWLCDLKISFIHSFPPGRYWDRRRFVPGAAPAGVVVTRTWTWPLPAHSSQAAGFSRFVYL